MTGVGRGDPLSVKVIENTESKWIAVMHPCTVKVSATLQYGDVYFIAFQNEDGDWLSQYDAYRKLTDVMKYIGSVFSTIYIDRC